MPKQSEHAAREAPPGPWYEFFLHIRRLAAELDQIEQAQAEQMQGGREAE